MWENAELKQLPIFLSPSESTFMDYPARHILGAVFVAGEGKDYCPRGTYHPEDKTADIWCCDRPENNRPWDKQRDRGI